MQSLSWWKSRHGTRFAPYNEYVQAHLDDDSVVLHRAAGPAVIMGGGTQQLYIVDGCFHRIDGPAIVRSVSDGMTDAVTKDGHYAVEGRKMSRAAFSRQRRDRRLRWLSHNS